METTRYSALILVDDTWGANYLIEEESASIRGCFESFGWELVTVSIGGRAAPCAYAAGLGMRPLATDLRVAELGEIGEYDALIVLPGRRHAALMADPAVLELVRRAEREGLAIAAFCRGAALLAAAGVLRGRRATAPLDLRSALEAGGARYVGYADARAKSDASPPVVDGNLVTALRTNYYRAQTCEAIRIAAANARAARRGGPLPGRARLGGSGSLAFAFPTKSCGREAYALASSIRRFGGELSGSPILALVPEPLDRADASSRNALEELGVELHPFPVDGGLASFPFGILPVAAACAEKLAEGRAEVLAWLNEDAVVLREPGEFLLPRGTVLGWRPVHHDLVGPRLGEALDGYWRAIYGLAVPGSEAEASDVPDRGPSTITTVDRRPFRFHVNAGMLALRPEAGILRRWAGLFSSSYAHPELAAFYVDPLRRYLAHQALLSASILASVPASAMRELSYAYNYPVHLQASVPRPLAARKAEDLVALRYDDWEAWLGAPDWRAVLPASGAWGAWADEMAARFRGR